MPPLTTPTTAVCDHGIASTLDTAESSTLTLSVSNSIHSSPSESIAVVTLGVLVLLAVLTIIALALLWRRRPTKKDLNTEIPTPYPFTQEMTARTKAETRNRGTERDSRRMNFHLRQGSNGQAAVVFWAELSRPLVEPLQSSRQDLESLELERRNSPPEYTSRV
ncbi:hypothetical protein Moror_16916 [Moniliophthora roreri MCA 2997]|uniref:Uncharacterized protein n=2 Tax=Moniliophthora roreri TaxID=221103 RepID=V2YDE0_MONRO|nr:hypothetical protein Moror_16916 [Moniliophthora roreri MCA 2997]